ncbi:MAG: hypothetical protein JWO22_2870 [Frankiales bacterium]|nr:hypothetical protein [Frankiales bacterium]
MDTSGSLTSPAPRTRRMPRALSVVLRLPRIGTWAGLVVVAAGFVLITIAWGDTAGTEIVGDQLPYVMSAGLVGLALVCVGATAVAIDAKLSDSAARRAQALELRDALAALRAVDEAAL